MSYFVYILNKLSLIALTFLCVSVLSFSLIRMVPGDPVMLLLGERGGSPEQYQKMKENLGLDKPLLQQYFHFATNLLSFDLGDSVVSKRPVSEEFFERFPATIELGLIALLFAVVVGIPLGILAAINRNGFFDYAIMGGSLLGYSMPIFWWGLILILIFSVNLGWTPVSGRMSVLYEIEPVTGFMLIDTWFSEEGAEAFWDAFRHLLLPALAMGTIPLAVIARMTRSSMLEVLGENYIRAAKAKGLAYWRIIFVHALKNAMMSVITVIGLMFGMIVTGAILTETIFSWPGIGKWMVASVMARDYPVIQSGIVIIALMVVVINTSVDFLYRIMNPRMRGQ